MTTRAEVVGRLSPAERARTIIAAGTHVGSPLGDASLMAPYLDVDGRPVLMVDSETSAHLLSVGAVDMQMGAAAILGTVSLSGWLQPLVAAQLNSQHRALLEARHACTGQGCARPVPSLVKVAVNTVRVSEPGGGLIPVSVGDYGAAEPNLVIAEGCLVAGHLNDDHVEEVLTLAGHVTGRHPSELLGASIEWIDEIGLDLSVIDVDGASSVRADFFQPLSSMADLGAQLHQLATSPPRPGF